MQNNYACYAETKQNLCKKLCIIQKLCRTVQKYEKKELQNYLSQTKLQAHVNQGCAIETVQICTST